jgi:hypothetical protein
VEARPMGPSERVRGRGGLPHSRSGSEHMVRHQ